MDKITVLSLLGFTQAHLNKLKAVSPRLNIQQITNPAFEDIPQAIRDQVEILYGWGNILSEHATQFPKLKWIQTHSAGIDFLLDTPVWHSDILISSINGIHAIPMSEHALAMIFAFRWRIPTMLKYKAKAEWAKNRWDIFSTNELHGSTLGIVGYGAIGRELARQASGLGMRILAVNRSGQRTLFQGYVEPGVGDPEAVIPEKIFPAGQLVEMLPECDYVVVVAPLTPETHHLFNRDTLSTMNPGSYLFNLGRGSLIDEPALIDALQRGIIAGAGLDVYEQEPLPPDSPLWQFDNVIISPHVSGFSLKYDDRASNVFAENLGRYLTGKTLLNQVDRGKGY